MRDNCFINMIKRKRFFARFKNKKNKEFIKKEKNLKDRKKFKFISKKDVIFLILI